MFDYRSCESKWVTKLSKTLSDICDLFNFFTTNFVMSKFLSQQLTLLSYFAFAYPKIPCKPRREMIIIITSLQTTGWKEEVMRIYQPDFMDNLGFDYDLHSIMQYKNTAFAKRAGLVTMQARSDPNMELGNQNAMSAADIMKINKLYQCSGSGDLCK